MSKFRPEKRRTPCSECPFRTNAIRGYLGADDPEHFLEVTMKDADMPCHMDIDYSDPDWLKTQEPDAPLCVGAMQFQNNQMKLSRDPEIAAAQDVVGTNERVFKRPEEFLAYHMSLPKWREKLPIPSRIYWRGWPVNKALGYFDNIESVEVWNTPDYEHTLLVAFDKNRERIAVIPGTTHTEQLEDDPVSRMIREWVTGGGPVDHKEMTLDQYREETK